MSIGQEQPPLSTDEELREYLNRRFIDIGSEFADSPKFPERKQMPYKPQLGDTHYFGDPAIHDYDTAIEHQGMWSYVNYGSGPRWAQLDRGLLLIEKAAMQGVVGSFIDGATIAPYAGGSAVDPDGLISNDPIAGSITIGVSGFYNITGYIAATGSNNQNFYGARIVSSIGGDFILGIARWENTTPGMAFNGSVIAHLVAGEVLTMKAYCELGTLDVVKATLSAIIDTVQEIPATGMSFQNMYPGGFP